MGSPDKKFDIVDVVRSWIPRRPESSNVSRDFWMPDQSCRVCYECDSQFTVFNRRHHCRLCGRVFCGKCASHSIPVPLDESRSDREECERIRVCSYCFKQWEQGLVTISHEDRPSCLGLSPSPSASSLGSLASSFSGISGNSTANSMAYSTGPYEHVLYNSCASPQPGNGESDRSTITRKADVDNPHSTSEPYDLSVMRSDDEDNEHSEYQSDLETRQFSQSDEYYGTVSFDDVYGSFNRDLSEEDNDRKAPGSLSPESFSTEDVKEIKTTGEELGRHISNEDSEASLYGIGNLDVGNFDFENNRLLWLPPEPEHEEDEREVDMFDDDDADNANGEWGYSRSSSGLSRGDLGNREKSNEEHRRAMRDVVSGHFRALIAQLLQVENLPVSEAYDQDSWLDIITSLSWETASLLKPDMSKGSGMDPGGYVKVKCLSCGHRRESAVIKGVVCKKNVAHRRMASKLDKPRLLILGGALEYQRVTNHLSSFNTLLKQEMDHLKMAVAKIGAHHPNILLVEKSVSRFAQEYLLAKNISLVLNIKRPLLERIARCTGAQIVPSIDHLVSPKLGFCGFFHVERYYEEHGSAGQGGKKQTKTLMFFEDCPKPLGCTILLKGAPGDELKKVKHVVHYGVFAAYHLALETSFLADEGASLPELPLKSPITVALPDKPSSINRSISTVPDFTAPTKETPPSNQNNCLISHTSLPVLGSPVPKSEQAQSSSQTQYVEPASNLIEPASLGSLSPSAHLSSDPYHNDAPQWNSSECIGNKGDQFPESDHSTGRAVSKTFGTLGSLKENAQKRNTDESTTCENDPGSLAQTTNDHNEKMQFSNDGFPPSSSDQQSILVSLTTRCLWKQVVCERAHLCRIKYYGSFDKPLGRFLQDHLFDQNYRCRSCDMPSEAHIYCYTHLQGSLTISVTKLHDNLLPGEREGKIWMWHRCLRCPRTMGDPPATRRVVMSDAAWGLSFGKFLELSFSNHAAASRVASCGHLLHRDCLRFYGCGRMVACFRYAPIKVYSVYLPRPKLEFNYDEQEWVQKEANEVSDGAKLLFTEVCSALNLILENVSHAGSSDGSMIAYELRKRIAQRERMLKKEKEEFEATLEKALNREATSGQPTIDILEINRLRRQLLLRSYIWDLRLRRAASLCSDILKSMEKPHDPSENTEKNAIPKAKISDEMPRTLLDEEADVERVNKTNSFNEERNLDEKSSNEKEGESVPRRKDADESDSLQSGNTVRKVLSDRQFPARTNISDTLDAVWTGESYSGNISPNENDSVLPVNGSIDASKFVKSASASSNLDKFSNSQSDGDIENSENAKIWFEMPFLNIYDSLNKHSSWNEQKLVGIAEYNPVYVLSFNEFKRQGGTRLLLPVGINDTVVPVYDDEPTSIISYVLLSQDYHHQMSNDPETRKNNTESSVSFPLSDSASLLSLISSGEIISGSLRTLASSEESSLSMSGPKNSQVLDPVFYNKSLHTRVSFAENGPLGKVKYSVTCYYAKRFEALRKICCPSELDFIRSLSRCKKWGAQGGKSNVFFAKTLDDRFIIKQVTKTELESFLKFAPAYFTYLSESISSGSPTCLAKILGMYQFTTKHVKGGKESKMDVLVMENLLFRRNVTRLYDLKGSSRSRYNPDSSGGNKVLLDQNLLETMPTSPIFLRNKAKRLLERAVWNDTSFLASIDVMDYSLLVGLDEERQELVLGIIDFMRQYTWDKHLETWVKASGILGGPKNASPTVISPEQYKKRFRKAMSSYFLMVPDQWSPPIIVLEGKSSSDLRDDKIRKSWPLTIDVSGLVLNPGCEVAKMGC